MVKQGSHIKVGIINITKHVPYYLQDGTIYQ